MLCGILLLSVGIVGLRTYSIVDADINDVPVIVNDDGDSLPDLVWFESDLYSGYLPVSEDGNSVYYNGHWYLIPALKEILIYLVENNSTDPDGSDMENMDDNDGTEDGTFDVDEYLDNHIPDVENDNTGLPPEYIYDESKITLNSAWIGIGCVLILTSVLLFLLGRKIHKKNK